jgi:pyruvate dehydrogenase E2 component (dihydrolipoamide acetyltransferase)
MTTEFRLPDVGEGVHEGEIVKWLVKPGEVVKEDQPLVEVMTDKATVEIPSPAAGTILELKAKEGEVVKVGSVLVVIGEAGAAAPQPDGRKGEVKVEAPTRASAMATTATRPATPTAAPAPSPTGKRGLATPATRKLARELSVDIAQVPGSGPGGRVIDADVQAFVKGGAAPAVAPALPQPTRVERAPTAAPIVRPAGSEGLEERLPLRGIRKVISDHMIHSVTTAARFTYVDEVDVTQLVKTREALKPIAEKHGVKMTYLPFIVKAVVGGLKRHPYLNASMDHEKQEIVLKRYYNIGIATATEQGLIVPVVKGADRLSMIEIAVEIERLSEKARTGKIALEELQGGTFTITSLGAQGGLFATPIINSPESAILGIHEIKKRPVVINDQIVIREIMLISLSFDHRLIDGHVGAAFAKEIKAFLEDPNWLMVGT